jgi:predicted metalloprotease with PDZ domain
LIDVKRYYCSCITIFFLFIINISAANSESVEHRSSGKIQQQNDIKYFIEPYYDINVMRFIVVFEFQGDKSGETKIILPGSYDRDDNINGIKYLKALSANTYIQDTDQPKYKIVKHPPSSAVRIYYQVEDVRDGELELGNHLMPIINKQYFNFYGETFFIVPACDNNIDFNFIVTWNHLPANWSLANSFGVNEKYQELNLPVWKFQHGVFSGGDFKILKKYIGKDLVYFSSRGNWNFSLEQLYDIFQDVLIEERNLWNDHTYPYFLISLLPVEGNSSQAGICRTNSFSLFLSKDRIIDFNLKQIIAHETFHNWLGEKINFFQPEQLIYWFKEGFCNYYARLILLRTGQISIQDYVKDYNKVLDEYFTSPVRYENNEKLITEFWSDPDYNKLPYQRGDIIAHNLNTAIMKNTNWQKSLDSFMRDLLKHSQKESLVISNGSLNALIRFYTGESILSDITRTLNSGYQLKVNPEALGPAFNVEQTTRRSFWLIGEKYEIPVYTLSDESRLSRKDMLQWFGIH